MIISAIWTGSNVSKNNMGFSMLCWYIKCSLLIFHVSSLNVLLMTGIRGFYTFWINEKLRFNIFFIFFLFAQKKKYANFTWKQIIWSCQRVNYSILLKNDLRFSSVYFKVPQKLIFTPVAKLALSFPFIHYKMFHIKIINFRYIDTFTGENPFFL